MRSINVHRADGPSGENFEAPTQGGPLAPLLVDIRGLSRLLARSIASLERDDAAGRLPSAVRIGASKRWRIEDVDEWVALGCPSRVEFEARRRNRP
jgi:predicted DNA-binding transcriptional regulator AlpA